MTVRTVRTCDRCGKEAERRIQLGQVRIDGKVSRYGKDLCNNCFALLDRFLKNS